MLIRPTPTPPKLQFSHMPDKGVSPARGLRLSCMQLTDPFDVQVVTAAQVGPADGPKRSSLPSRLPQRAWSTGSGGSAATSSVLNPAVPSLSSVSTAYGLPFASASAGRPARAGFGCNVSVA